MLRMKRVSAPLMASVLSDTHCTCGASHSTTVTVSSQKRFLKCHDVREYVPLGMPIEMKFYQRYTTRPEHASGIQFLTHYSDHRRWWLKNDLIDYMNWGREQGQAHLPHRHQRVAFDFHDKVNPTHVKGTNGRGKFEGQDPSFNDGAHSSISGDFNPRKELYSEPIHFRKFWGERRPHDLTVNIRKTKPLDPRGGQAFTMGYSRVAGKDEFSGVLPERVHDYLWGNEDVTKLLDLSGMGPGRVPGVNAPFRGEEDTQQMQAMSVPLTPDNLITANDGRFSKGLYINYPTRDNVLTATLAKNLGEQIDVSTNALYSKLTVLKAAQSGITDRFSAGMDLEQYSYDIAMAEKYEKEAAELTAEMAGGKGTKTQKVRADIRLNEKIELATRHRMRVDDALRSQSALLWRTFTAARPLMTLINGRCHNTGCGLALLSKFPALRDSTELIVDGPNYGLTPYGGMTNLLARPETAGKMPGLAEFTVLTGNALYAGDALRLGWSEYYTNYADMDYHIKDWFNNSEHMHNDAIAWQLGHLLEKCFKMQEHHSTALERSAVTPTRAKWIEDAFADQKSVEAIVSTLSAMEKLPTNAADAAAAGNNFDINTVTPYSLYDIHAGIEKLSKNNLHFALAPWEITAPEGDAALIMEGNDGPIAATDSANAKSSFAAIFTDYVFERDAKGREVAVLPQPNRLRMKAWRKQRYQEYQDYVSMMHRPVKRHVFARIEGCDGKMINFEHFFDRRAAEQSVAEAELKAMGESASFSDQLTAARGVANNAMLKDVLKKIAEAAGFDTARPLELGWYLPTLDTAQIRTDDELMQVLQNDPGFEAPSEFPTAHPPIYFIIKRPTLHMSEWAYATKHQLLLQSPFALKASFQLLNDVRNGRAKDAAKKAATAAKNGEEEPTELEMAENSIQSISETLATEFRYISRLVKRPDFYKVGFNASRTMSQWEQMEGDRAVNLHESDSPTGKPVVAYDDVFDRDVAIDGHKFLVRPKWSPATLEEVNDAEIAALSQPLNFAKDKGLTEIHVPTYTNKAHRIAASINDNGGFEVVPGLGEPIADGKKAANGAPTEFKVAPLESDAHVPNNVNFYIMARHPWTDQANSWRQDTFTDASLEYMTAQYKDALTQINRGSNPNAKNEAEANRNSSYWPSKAEVEGDGSFEAEEESLLRDRLYNAVDVAAAKVEQWASSLRADATKSALDYKIEITSQQERFYDDNYYRWFIRPGEHPNPSGLLRDGKAVAAPSDAAAEGGSIDPETLMASFDDNFSTGGGAVDDGSAAVAEAEDDSTPL